VGAKVPGQADDERNPKRLLVGGDLSAGDPVGPLEPAVVRREEDRRVRELVRAAERPDDLRQPAVDGAEGGEAAAELAGQGWDRLRAELMPGANEARLVGNIGLVERGRLGEWLMSNRWMSSGAGVAIPGEHGPLCG
jgi:hypothetical protein